MKTSWLRILTGLIVAASLFGWAHVVYLDALFLGGLILFMAGGFVFMLEKRVFDRFFQSFKKFLRSTSKLEEYVSETEGSRQPAVIRTSSFSVWALHTGLFVMLMTTVIGFYYF
ncbi:hypothetical protein JOC94_001825 [Bacillus thermophilus]|uniref:DUF3899 domain-containing protein n=1 Tax=Siminovitchia thermophila TaxID=1245522 RepID=A0ABS2R7L4_9BACI|nr:DUF3899 domain-containing protein [Siminovitchia thermophila]MBM7714853.1 hypothetical protein [Siminovitchia thermophila]ONK21739.1 hypothetical protein BLX87_19805 [Bacillus sp. VT-16-64]